MFKEIIKPALILFLICAVMAGALAYVNAITEPVIAQNEKLAEQQSLSQVFADANNFSDAIEASSLIEKGYSVTGSIEKLYEAQKDGESIGYVIAVSSRGYGGEIKMLVGIDNASNIKGVTLTSHNETPGLGANVGKSSFTNQFEGEIPKEAFFVVKHETANDNEIQAVTAATVSSKAVTAGVADAVTLISSMSGGE